jgi:uncharacterized repeat protein (TIGR03803 family)
LVCFQQRSHSTVSELQTDNQCFYHQNFKEMKMIEFHGIAHGAMLFSRFDFPVAAGRATSAGSRRKSRDFRCGSRIVVALLLLLAVGRLGAQARFWGTASAGGEFGAGAIINMNTDGSDIQSIPFVGIAGANPVGDLLLASNGKLYGMTPEGGEYNSGVIFEYDRASDTYQALHSFAPATDGGKPLGSLIESGGKLYGMSSEGGDFGYGTIFEFNPSGNVYMALKHFDGTDGGNSRGSLLASGGKFYGMSYSGGNNGQGVLFEFNPSGNVYSVLFHFGSPGNGGYPFGSLVASGGKFYGMLPSGGNEGYGVLFEFNPTGNVYNVLKHLSPADGSFPYGSLLVSGGKFYGMCSINGNIGSGTIFEFNPSGNVYNVLHHFGFDGGNPYGSLTLLGGKLYGMFKAGISGGALFELNPVGNVFTELHYFDDASGYFPEGSLTVSGGKLYGMASRGGKADAGSLFEFNPSGNVYTVLRHFNYAPNGGTPNGDLTEWGGKYYGMTTNGGSFSAGTLFEFNPSGSVYSVLKHLDAATDGAYPYGNLTVLGGKFYGMTSEGGSNGYGTLFEFNPAGNVFTVLKHFDYSADGARPYGNLTVLGGKLYGMTYEGGSNGDGTLFEWNPAGNAYTVLWHLDYLNDGSNPYGSLLASGGKLYGMSTGGGIEYSGTLFEFNLVGNALTVLHYFDYSPEYGYPHNDLIESGGKFYGLRSEGGDNDDAGLLFEYDPIGDEYSVLHHFDFPTGKFPFGSLVEYGGKFYGTANEGGDYEGGVVFEYNPAGSTYNVIRHLDPKDGSFPQGSLLVAIPALRGKLIWENDDASGVGNATVTLSGSQSGSFTTNSDGTFTFSITSGSSLTITPTKSSNKLNGLSTADVTRIQRHITNIEPLTDPYKIVAADVNKTNSVNSQDASIINLALLGNPSAINQIKTSWRFIPVSHTLNLPPWGFPESRSVLNAGSSTPSQDFYGIKTGDVVSPFTNPANLQGEGDFVLTAQDQPLEAGTQVVVSLDASQFDDLAALQFALRFDTEKLALTDIAPLGGLPLSTDHFGTYELSEGLIKMAWAQAQGIAVEEAAPLFSLTFNVLSAGGLLSEALQLDDTALEGHAYTGELSDNRVELAFSSTTATGTPVAQTGIRLLQNRPNPFNGQTVIGFVLPEACEAQLRVFDAAGRVLFVQQKKYAAGKHEEMPDLTGASGVLWYELTTPSGILVKKMVAVGK